MAIPSGGNISISELQTEFGGTNPIGISEYYNVDPFKPVPVSGEISLNNFRGSTIRTTKISTGESDDYNPRRGYSAANGSFYYTQESGQDRTAFGSASRTTSLFSGTNQLSAFIIQRPTADIGIQMVTCMYGTNSDAFSVLSIKAAGGGTYSGYTWQFYESDSAYQSLSNTSPQCYGYLWDDGMSSYYADILDELYDHMNDNRAVILKFT
mgnify:CR=1 FL=1